jgi:hypothetical protein
MGRQVLPGSTFPNIRLSKSIPDINPEWFKEDGQLYGYIPTGTVTLNNSQSLTLDQLIALVGQFMTGQISIKSITIE